ncbi:MAG: hypothetical protein ACTSPM_14050, partial [Candidatus Heimdallarchaeota archaeon]
EEISAGSDPLNADSTPITRRNLLALSIGLSSAILLIAILVVFLLAYRFTRPEQRMFRYIDSQREKGKVSLSTKEITMHLDRKLNKGEIKQLVVEHSKNLKITLTGNTIWLSSEENLVENIQTFKKEISSFKSEGTSAVKASTLKTIKKDIITDRKAAVKLKLTKLDEEYSTLLVELEEISSIKTSPVSTPPEPEIVEESSTETFAMPDISSSSSDENPEEVVDPDQLDE